MAAGTERAAAAAATRRSTAARQLGSRWLVEELTTLGDRARLGLGRVPSATNGDGDGDGRPGVDGAPEPDPFGLTPRERQVLGLLAQGATNRQIGAALFMAEKTASVHVSRILAKLDVQGRTQAAAVAHRPSHLSVLAGERRFPTVRTPAEWEPHERTLMGWPCRVELWGETMDQARADYAAVANAVAAFEPVTMIANPGRRCRAGPRRLRRRRGDRRAGAGRLVAA